MRVIVIIKQEWELIFIEHISSRHIIYTVLFNSLLWVPLTFCYTWRNRNSGVLNNLLKIKSWYSNLKVSSCSTHTLLFLFLIKFLFWDNCRFRCGCKRLLQNKSTVSQLGKWLGTTHRIDSDFICLTCICVCVFDSLQFYHMCKFL